MDYMSNRRVYLSQKGKYKSFLKNQIFENFLTLFPISKHTLSVFPKPLPSPIPSLPISPHPLPLPLLTPYLFSYNDHLISLHISLCYFYIEVIINLLYKWDFYMGTGDFNRRIWDFGKGFQREQDWGLYGGDGGFGWMEGLFLV